MCICARKSWCYARSVPYRVVIASRLRPIAVTPKNPAAAASPRRPKPIAHAAVATVMPRSISACPDTRTEERGAPAVVVIVDSATAVTSTPSTNEAIRAPGLKPKTKGANIRIGPTAASMAAWNWIGMSLAIVSTVELYPIERAFLCEADHISGNLSEAKPARMRSGGRREYFLCMSVGKKRLDTVLVERGLFESRSQAAAAVVAGTVLLGAERSRAAKPGMAVEGGIARRGRARAAATSPAAA